MEINSELLKRDLEQLQHAREQMLANLNAHNGAIEYCQKLLQLAVIVPEGEAVQKTDEAAPAA